MRIMAVLFAVFAALVFLQCTCAHILPPLSNLRFPYGEDHGDSKLSTGANPATMMQMTELYFLYGGICCELFVTDNGFVSFGKAMSSNAPQTFPIKSGAYQLQKTPLVAVYWSDVDMRCGGGDIYYRFTSDAATLADIGSVVKELGTAASLSFVPKEALIVSYEEVTSCSSTGENTFQLVIVTDGIGNSFAVQHYLKLSWGSVNAPATVGGNAGDRKRGYNLFSPTGKITDLVYQTNIGHIGVFVFDLNSGYTGGACSSFNCQPGAMCQVYAPTGQPFCSPSCCLDNGGCSVGEKCFLTPDQCAQDPCPPKVYCSPTSAAAAKAEWEAEFKRPSYPHRYSDYGK